MEEEKGMGIVDVNSDSVDWNRGKVNVWDNVLAWVETVKVAGYFVNWYIEGWEICWNRFAGNFRGGKLIRNC